MTVNEGRKALDRAEAAHTRAMQFCQEAHDRAESLSREVLEVDADLDTLAALVARRDAARSLLEVVAERERRAEAAVNDARRALSTAETAERRAADATRARLAEAQRASR